MIIAKHFVEYQGTVYTPGEVLPDGIDESQIRWWLKKDAVELRGAEAPAEAAEPEEAPEDEPEEPENEPEEADAECDEDEFDDEPAPTVDVSAAIAPPKRGRARKGGSK
jgi:hypothetical protein